MSNYDSTSGHTSLPEIGLREARLPSSSAAAAANHALDEVGHAAHGLVDEVQALNQRGQAAWRGGMNTLRESATRGTEQTRHYVQAQPLKAVLLAAGAGAALVALWGLLSGPRRGR
jgi:ElaB/YqjD/DUF883 family membrane-anchored ribosome-binding protein